MIIVQGMFMKEITSSYSTRIDTAVSRGIGGRGFQHTGKVRYSLS